MRFRYGGTDWVGLLFFLPVLPPWWALMALAFLKIMRCIVS